MWWRFYNSLSLKIIDHVIDHISPNSNDTSLAPSSEISAPPAKSKQLQNMMQEITQDMSIIAEQQRLAVKAELASHARALALSEISHDLRTPLNAIIGFTQLMESGIFGDVGNVQYNEYLRHIRESGYELLERIEELLNTSPDDHTPLQKAKSPALQEFAA